MTNKMVEKRKRRNELLKASRRLDKEGLDRKKHWGTGKKIEEYENAIKDSLNLQPLEDALKQFNQEALVSENIFDQLSNLVDFEDLFKAEMIDKLQGLVAESFKQGSSRVITVDGETLSIDFEAKPERLIDQLQSQEIYLKNLSEDAEEKVRETIIEGSEEGKSIGEMQDDILNNVEDLTEHRSETIARSEIIEASNKGSQEALKEAGVEEVMVHASIDRQTCEEGSFSWTSRDGTEYTSCQEWHQEVFKREDAPQIPSESHPNDRCALLAYVE